MVPYDAIRKNPHICNGMAKELSNLLTNNRIQVIPRPPGARGIGSKWVHKQTSEWKSDGTQDGPLVRSRLCPRGFQQKEGIEGLDFDPHNIAAPTPHIETLFIALALQVNRNMFTNVIDEKSAFSTTPNEKTVYLEFPDGMTNTPNKDFILRLNNSINGTKQAANDYYRLRAKKLLTSLNFKVSIYDPSFFWQWIDGQLIFILLWTDDYRLSADTQQLLDKYSQIMMSERDCVLQPGGDNYLGLKIKHNRHNGTLTIDAKEKIIKMLTTSNMQHCNPVSTPGIVGSKLRKSQTLHVKQTDTRETIDYRSTTATALWISRYARFDNLYAVKELMAYAHNYDSTHLSALKHLLRYFKGSIDEVMTLHRGTPGHIQLAAYADADWAGLPDDAALPRRSTSGCVIYLQQIGAIFAQSVTQKEVAQSTASAEYISANNAARRIMGCKHFLQEIGFPQNTVPIHEDNETCIEQSQSLLMSAKNRHLSIKTHYIRQLVEEEEIKLVPIDTHDQVADLQTKYLDKTTTIKHRDAILGKQKGLR